MLDLIATNLNTSNSIALVINDKHYSYQDLCPHVKKYYNYLLENPQLTLLGIIMRNDLQTYALITATFLSNCGYVILNLAHPIERNTIIAEEAGLDRVFSSLSTDAGMVPPKLDFFYPELIPDSAREVSFLGYKPDSIAYVLFTSGSTGSPKGVKITKSNLDAFLLSLSSTPIAVQSFDRVIQMYDLTFDASILMLVPALCAGATIYTTDSTKIKIIDIARILTTYPLTYMFLVPSIMSLLKPYIDDIYVPTLKTVLIGGEPVTKSVLSLIQSVAPNADLWNFYGPTETTVGVVITKIDQIVLDGCYNGIVPIGRPMPGVFDIVVDDGKIVTSIGQKGELLIGGGQVTAGYVNDDNRNKSCFPEHEYNGRLERFYATGDLVLKNKNGDYSYCGRIDHQVKIQGYRIELNEIEYYASLAAERPVVALVKEIEGNQQLVLFVENYQGSNAQIMQYLESKLPPFMVPRNIVSLRQFPVTASDKVDRVKLSEYAID